MRVLIVMTMIFILVGLGIVLAENFVGEKRLLDINLFPEQFSPPPPLAIPSEAATIAPISPDWQTFRSLDHSFYFRYPPGWQIIETSSSAKSKGVYGVPVQTWLLVNYQFKEESNLPDDGVRVEFEILSEGQKESVNHLINCETAEAQECRDWVVNGVTYKRLTTKSRTGMENIKMVTVKNDLIYRVSGLVNAERNQKGRQQIEQILSTLEIIESS